MLRLVNLVAACATTGNGGAEWRNCTSTASGSWPSKEVAGRSAARRTESWSLRSTRRARLTPTWRSPRPIRAFHAGPWPTTPARERGDLLLRVADLLERDTALIARAESLDTGKRLVESEYDVADVVSVFRHFGHTADEDAGRVVDTGNPSVVSRIVHEPVGVCGLITPWNYPLLQVAWKVAPCLAAGNTFVLKPSELTPHTAIHLMKVLEEAGLPAGVANLVLGDGPGRRSAAQRGPARRPGLVHRGTGDRQADHGGRGRHREEGRARARGQEPQHRVRRRRQNSLTPPSTSR